jgi:hypothetical protein
MGFKIISDIRRPSLATHCWRHSRNFFITLWVISGGMASISCRILSFKSSRDRGRCLKTFSFRYHQRKKSRGLKSGDRASHSTSPLKEIKRPGNISLNTPSERGAVWAVAPSCWNVHRSNPWWVLKTVEANQPHETYPTSTPTTARTVTPRNVGDLFAPPCISWWWPYTCFLSVNMWLLLYHSSYLLYIWSTSDNICPYPNWEVFYVC